MTWEHNRVTRIFGILDTPAPTFTFNKKLDGGGRVQKGVGRGSSDARFEIGPRTAGEVAP